MYVVFHLGIVYNTYFLDISYDVTTTVAKHLVFELGILSRSCRLSFPLEMGCADFHSYL